MPESDFTPKETERLRELRSRLGSLYQEPDQKLVAWLRARDLNVKRAEQLLRQHLIWRRNNELEELTDWVSPKCYYPAIESGQDREGCPVFIMPIGHWDLRSPVELGEIVPALRYSYQMVEKCLTAAHAKGLYQVNLLMDFEGFSYKQVANKSVLQGILELIRIYEANYPEILKNAFVINAPKLFHVLYAMTQPFFHSRTLARVQIFGGDRDKWREAILGVVPEEGLPVHWGGTRPGKDEYCSESWLCEPLPKYYMRKTGSSWDEHGDQWFIIVVGPKEKITLEYETKGDRECTLSWAFTTEGYDIGFFVSCGDEVLVSNERTESHVREQTGTLLVGKGGKYIVTFDNSYSKRRSKTLNYTVKLT